MIDLSNARHVDMFGEDTTDAFVQNGPKVSGKAEFLVKVHEAEVAKMHASVADWRVPEIPELDDRYTEIILDFETTGLRWWDGDHIIGAGLWLQDGSCRYLPVRHKVGPNIPVERFQQFLRSIRGKRVTNIRTKFDLHMSRVEGIDLEAQDNTFGDVAHYAALLDDHRIKFNQHDLVKAFLPPDSLAGKVTTVNGYTLDPKRFAEYPAGLVAPRAENDVFSVAEMQRVMMPMLDAQDLQRVRIIEDQVLPVVVEMEHNGCLIDVATLTRWVGEAAQQLEDTLWRIKKLTGVDMSSPDNRNDQARLFAALNLEIPRLPDKKTGVIKPSFADEALEALAPGFSVEASPYPAITLLRKAKALKSLLSKFLLKYHSSTTRDGILRYELHQLPFERDRNDGKDGGGGGAVSGRFSSAAPSREEGANIQQVFGVDAQEQRDKQGVAHGFTKDFVIKKLFRPDRSVHKNAVWLKADASQFQFRIFAHYSNAPDIIKGYSDDLEKARLWLKLTDYHEIVQDLILTKAGKELNRVHTKNVNFAQVFGAGIRKMASQIGVPADQIPGMGEPLESGGPLFQEVVEISEIYHGMFPEVKPMLSLTGHLAMPEHKTEGKGKCGMACRRLHRQGYFHRGHVRTYLGRRARFGPRDRHYSALNRIIQGTEGDFNKRTLIEVHKRRHELGVLERFTVHDEWSGDMFEPSPESITRFREVLNTQYYEFKVPILWECGIGPSWGQAKTIQNHDKKLNDGRGGPIPGWTLEATMAKLKEAA